MMSVTKEPQFPDNESVHTLNRVKEDLAEMEIDLDEDDPAYDVSGSEFTKITKLDSFQDDMMNMLSANQELTNNLLDICQSQINVLKVTSSP